MSRLYVLSLVILLSVSVLLLAAFGNESDFWPQWGHDPQHSGQVGISGQKLNKKIADFVYDPFTTFEKAENKPLFGEAVLSAHFQATLVDRNSFYMIQKTGTYYRCNPNGKWGFGFDCGPNRWNSIKWNVARYDWHLAKAVRTWVYATDWVPEPNATNVLKGYVGLTGWEPVFHPALANGYLYVPGAGGTVWKVDKETGQTVSNINPFSGMNVDPASTFVAGPLTADSNGNIYYNALELNTNGNPWNQNDISGSWLVKIGSDDSSATVTYLTLVPNAPPGSATTCPGNFASIPNAQQTLPWPPTLKAMPPTELCGSQRAPLNVAPAVAPDGTIYTVSMAHFDNAQAYLVAVNPDLTPKWVSSMQNRLTDGCGVTLPIAPKGVYNLQSSCRFGVTVGIDPTTNANGNGVPSDLSSSTPTVLPDGSVLFGATSNYAYSRGHALHFDAQGNYLNSYSFGWDSTPAVYQHDGTYSIVIKDNHYGGPAYCTYRNSPVCAPLGPGPYYVSQLDPNLNVEWSFQNTTIDPEHPNGYEWCVNAPVVDRMGVVYITSEDGNVYTVSQGHTGVFTDWKQKIFLLEALGAAYTPLSIGEHGEIYSQNNGHLFVVGQ